MEAQDEFWDRRTNFWRDKGPARSRVASSKVGRGASRGSGRVRALSRGSKLSSLCALASTATLLAVLVYGLVASDDSREPAGGRAARAPEGLQAGGRMRAPSLGPLGNAVPVASVTNAPSNLAAATGAPPAGAVDPSQASVGSIGGG